MTDRAVRIGAPPLPCVQKHLLAVCLLVADVVLVIVPIAVKVRFGRPLHTSHCVLCAHDCARTLLCLSVIDSSTVVHLDAALPPQIENEKFQLFFLLMHVPGTVVKSLARLAERGYDRMQQQIAAETTGADDFDRDNGLEDNQEVRASACFVPCRMRLWLWL